MADREQVRHLEGMAVEMRRNLLRLALSFDGPVHLGGDMSMTELLIALYHYGMNVDPADIRAAERDRFILSKGHGAVGMYIAMALRGFYEFDDILATYGQFGSAYGMHPCRTQLPALESSTGSLGHGLPIAVGLAFAARQRKQTHRVFTLIGDGESCEGSIWEAANTAGSYGLGNLVGVVDFNKQLMTNLNGNTMNLEPFADKWRAFRWNTIEVDGHDMAAICDVLDNLPPADGNRPTMIVAHTIKGKGVSFMERSIAWHANNLNQEFFDIAMAEIDAAAAKLEGAVA
ncbi:transketolase [Novosphingobium malaysiense]|uniref:Transketolase N-terminal domain-containing protein n=1 Tax=Novosphingobium malaysiense TaxID=1348853 RepID=A0A0B1ZM27_9SPHN|nr:transketolase [Novosphingobium malaysiense]KHK90340.1 hypothetical protein LK12_17175 [Novosphingobium malaysiense]